jgi:hypothetical protein
MTTAALKSANVHDREGPDATDQRPDAERFAAVLQDPSRSPRPRTTSTHRRATKIKMNRAAEDSSLTFCFLQVPYIILPFSSNTAALAAAIIN